ncbi:hypothetical protein K458DRAFT_424700 [Lentithecium fluviatile CBS 122367]|uniref:BZIP domain-containing protein n=1 Tax=Lentithecium fluviatile CBS 122367 TaxID=1168545 RepID=A0A6G1IEU3_9PLEO|nr:hypothetical protein K458DRAFT_424700 [Lentithecium fluviatile CBS 122367]
MEVDTNSYDWANDTFVALHDHGLQASSEKWSTFSNASPFSQSAFTIPPSLLSHGSIERFGQVTPPEELSPAEPRRDSAREGSIPLEQLKNEALFPDHQLQALQDYQPQQQSSQTQSPTQDGQERASKRRRTSRQSTNHTLDSTNPTSPQPQQEGRTLQPPKRKRGRPKSQPQMVEAYTPEGFPFQVSSARQSHLEKNRVAAHKCRMRKKDYINSLEDRARVYTTKNKALKENVAMLREEVLELKNEVLRHAGCGFWAVDEYLARCAGDLLGMKPPVGTPGPGSLQQTPALATTTLQPDKMHRTSSAESLPNSGIGESPDRDDYGGFDMLEDMDDEFDAREP